MPTNSNKANTPITQDYAMFSDMYSSTTLYPRICHNDPDAATIGIGK